jgi:hypothetical protein
MPAKARASTDRFVLNVISHKGGSGKTTISLALARGCHERGLRCLLADIDFTGTSLEALIHGESSASSLPFLDDIILRNPFEGRRIPPFSLLVRKIPYNSSSDSTACYIPSRTGTERFREIAPFLYAEETTGHFRETLRKVIEEGAPRFDIFILDNAPGPSGLSETLRAMEFDDNKYRWKLINIHVTSCDRQDALCTFESFVWSMTNCRRNLLKGRSGTTLSADQKRSLGAWVGGHRIAVNRYLPVKRHLAEKFVDANLIDKMEALLPGFKKSQSRKAWGPFYFDDVVSVSEAPRLEGSWPGLEGYAPQQWEAHLLKGGGGLLDSIISGAAPI